MALKPDIVKDLLCVIAFGTPSSRPPAANLLFYYWPSLNPTLYDRRGIHIKFSGKSCTSSIALLFHLLGFHILSPCCHFQELSE